MWRIDNLSPIEEGWVSEARREWGLMHFRSMPADRQKTEAACRVIYRQLGRPVPTLLWWVQSPEAARITTSVLERYFKPSLCTIPHEPPRSLRDLCRSDIGTQVLDQVWDQLWRWRSETDETAWDRIGRSLADSIAQRLVSNAYEMVVKGVHPHIVARMCAQGADLIRWCETRDELYRSVVQDPLGQDPLGQDPLGHLDRLDNWLVFACHHALSPHRIPMLDMVGLAELWKHSGGWCPYRGAVLFVERPVRLCLDPQDRLHSADGMALAYPDGAGLYAWHGVTVPKDVILRPDDLAPFDILHEPNVEVRRIMIERFGLDRLLSQTRSQCLDVDQDGRRALYRLRLAHDEPVVAVKVRCPSTNQVYFLRVPPAIRTCRDAVAWTFGFEKREDYQPLVET